MKKIIITTALFIYTATTLFAQYEFASYKPGTDSVKSVKQDLYFEMRSRYQRPVKKDELSQATLLREVIPGYPINWITSYETVEITAAKGNDIARAKGKNEKLTTEQKTMLASASIGTDIIVDVKYSYLHPLTRQTEYNTIHTTVTVAPDNEASFLGMVPDFNELYNKSNDQAKKYLRENCINKVMADIPAKYQKGIVTFMVNENGKTTNVRLVMKSGSDKMDKLLLDVITNMPKWKPAQNSKGENVKQEFEFIVGAGGC